MPVEPRSFAYSLSQREDGWSWSVYDEDGQTVAGGADASRDGAQAAVEKLLNFGGSVSDGSSAAA